ncbi:unnamed protein product [Arabidopsis thaliana]|uniref:(thale cress) hypothetical protein n=1 Tax=Arabidopsis thaliana TaxID=3702 RepID=A0A7G2F1V4_ARATH|nr:unnamed protein product [Arabidopsis thaliana]
MWEQYLTLIWTWHKLAVRVLLGLTLRVEVLVIYLRLKAASRYSITV